MPYHAFVMILGNSNGPSICQVFANSLLDRNEFSLELSTLAFANIAGASHISVF